MTSNNEKMTSNNENIDEFGRDLSLKPTNQSLNSKAASEFCTYVSRFKGMSWADIDDMVEEEEEQARINAEREELRKILAERKELLKKGLYDLEEGEELDL